MLETVCVLDCVFPALKVYNVYVRGSCVALKVYMLEVRVLDCVFPALKVYMLEVRVLLLEVGLRVPRPEIRVYVRGSCEGV